MISTELASVCNIEMGQAPAGSSYNSIGEGLPLLAGAGDFGVDFPAASKFTSSPTKVSAPNDIIMCIRATIGDLNWSDRHYCLGRGVAGLRPKPKSLDRNYLWHWLSYARADLEKKARGSTFKQVSKKDVAELEIPLPNTLNEQRRIAAILDKADAIRRKREQALTLADDFLRSVFLEMFGDPVTNPKGFREVRLDAIADIASGLTKGRKTKADEKLYAVPYMRVANVQDGFLDLSEIKLIDATTAEIERYALKADDLLLTEGGDPDKLGRGSVWSNEIENCIHQNHIFRVRVRTDDIHPIILQHQVGSLRGKSYFLRAAKQTTGIASINKQQLSAYPTLIPDRDLQKRYLEIIRKFGATQVKLQAARQETSDLFAALSQRAFAGDL